MFRFALQLIGGALFCATAFDHNGIVYGGDEWTSPLYPFGGPTSALSSLAQTGATHVRVICTQYQANTSSTFIYPINGSSPLASANMSQTASVLQAARTMGLQLTLAPILDLDWDIPTNARSISSPYFASRRSIGASFSSANWADWFQAYKTFITPYATLAQQYNVSLLELGSDLDIAFTTRAADWRALVAAVRKVYSGNVTISATFATVSNITWWDALDYVTGDMYATLGSTLPLGTAPAVDDLVTAWAPVLAQIEAVVNATGKTFLITEVGYQSRSSCHVRPWGTQLHDVNDDSAWLEDHDPACQANAYEALFRAFSGYSWFAGVYWSLWTTDPTHGGTGDTSFTPHGKPAEVVLRRWYGNYTCTETGGYGAHFLDETTCNSDTACSTFAAGARTWVDMAKDGSDNGCDGSADIIAAIASSHSSMAATKTTRVSNITKKAWNGFCFGGPDEWSYPGYRFDSIGAQTSLNNMITTGADSVEVIVQWYFDNVTSTEMYPIPDVTNPLRTSTDEELISIITYAKSKNLKTLLTPMLDPNWMLPAQNWCRDSNDPSCYWRGQVGIFWGSDCSPDTPWAAWFTNYQSMVVHYARLAESLHVDAFLISHELEHANQKCPELWYDLLAAVRVVYRGQVSAAFQPSLLTTLPLSPWAGNQTGKDSLDFIGIDCYLALPLPTVFNNTNHASQPWVNVPLDTLLQAAQNIMPPFRALAAAAQKQIACTEVGWSTRPWAWSTWGGQTMVDPEDCSVHDQCVVQTAQQLAYQWFLPTYYAEDWHAGTLFWTWRADPTDGGTSHDGFSVAGKLSAGTVASYWA
jgi:hypothetical protein